MPKLPEIENTTQHLLESRKIERKIDRGYLGASAIGGKCWRAIWYSFHFVSKNNTIPIKLQRIFNRGHLEEARVIKELQDAGIEVFKRIGNHKYPITGDIDEEQEELVGFAGHVKGHPDGRILGIPESSQEHLLEIKTAKDSRFKDFLRNGIKDASPTYYAQAQWLMGKMKLKRCLFVVTNKNDESRYYERVYFDKDAFEELERKSLVIVTSISPPDKIHHSKNWIDCKFCDHRAVCHEDAEPAMSCRTCEHADIEDNGVWSCGFHDVELTLDEQLKGCRHYEKGWGL